MLSFFSHPIPSTLRGPRPGNRLLAFLLTLALMLPMLASCGANFPALLGNQTPPAASGSLSTPLPPLPVAEIHFRVHLPGNPPSGKQVYLSVLDEVTGLALNAKNYTMQATSEANVYTLTLPVPVGSLVKYRYERQAAGATVAEHTTDGRAVRYRLYHVDGPGTVEDVVSRWTDTPFEGPTGRIKGQALDAASGQPIPNLLVAAGGQQTLSAADGSFLLEGLPVGVHNLVAFAMDGAYATFQQGARVAEGSTTPVPLSLSPAPAVNVTFIASLPQGTPPVVPVRLAGSLYQLGNSFATLAGGVSLVASNLPRLTALPDGRYSLTVSLPVGADVRYKYTLGDGFWNAEHTADGGFRLRQLVVPDHDVVVEDTVEAWQSGKANPLSFDLSVPDTTPATDSIYIQLKPVFGWTEPLPMWKLGKNRWAYLLYSPLNLPGELAYRFCRNAQCGVAEGAATAGAQNAVQTLQPNRSMKNQVSAWAGLSEPVQPYNPPDLAITPRGSDFAAGVEFQPAYHPSWRALLPDALDGVKSLGANWLALAPTWTWIGQNPPVLQPVPGQDALWPDLVTAIQQGQARGLQVALNPTPRFPTTAAAWWQGASRDFGWWLVWFEQYRTFALQYADLAARSQASALILGGNWVTPALPGGSLADGSPSGMPADAQARWQAILDEVRSHYSGKIYWALPVDQASSPPPFLSGLDGIDLLWTSPPGDPATVQAATAQLLDGDVHALQSQSNLPLLLSVDFDSRASLQQQAADYELLLSALNERAWISGLISRGYYPPTALQDAGPSVNGKPAAEVLRYWYPRLTGAVSP